MGEIIDSIGNFDAAPPNGRADVAIVGGGLAGLTSAILLKRYGFEVTLFEKKRYPVHRVCGEYISNETVPFLKANGLFPDKFKPETISRLQLTSVNGKSGELVLDLGGFGISRYSFDSFLYNIAVDAGVNVMCGTTVNDVERNDDSFQLATSRGVFEARVVIGAYGKRSKLDFELDRNFVNNKSPYLGVKYHIKIDHPHGLIALHNFKDGYCGISNVENGITNLCYLSHRRNMKEHGNIRRMEEEVLFRNPFLRSIFERAEFVFERPEVINEISFQNKPAVEDGILMIGDTAGMITPLCGNGMAMAIRSAKLVTDIVPMFLEGKIERREMEFLYESVHSGNFSKRLWVGRQVQRLFGGEATSNFAVNLVRNVKPVANFLVRQTHGPEF